MENTLVATLETLSEETKKVCIQCHEEKPLSEFTFSNRTKDNLQPLCKCCKSIRGKKATALLRQKNTELGILIKEKICPSCKFKKNKSEFTINRSRKDGLHSECRKCAASRQQSKRECNAANNLLNAAKHRAKKQGIAFNLTKEDIEIKEFCPVFNIPLKINLNGKTFSDNSPTLDRIDPTKGYIKGNVEVISWMANRLKNNGTIPQMEMVLAYMKRNIKGTKNV